MKTTTKLLSKSQVEKILKDLREGYRENGEEMGDDIAFDIADSQLFDEPSLEDSIKKHWSGVTDVKGFIANYIS